MSPACIVFLTGSNSNEAPPRTRAGVSRSALCGAEGAAAGHPAAVLAARANAAGGLDGEIGESPGIALRNRETAAPGAAGMML